MDMTEEWNFLEFEGQYVVYHITIWTDKQVCLVNDTGRQQLLGLGGREQELYLLDCWMASSVRCGCGYELWLQRVFAQSQAMLIAFESGRADAAAEVWSPARGILTHTCLGRREWHGIREMSITPGQAIQIVQDLRNQWPSHNS